MIVGKGDDILTMIFDNLASNGDKGTVNVFNNLVATGSAPDVDEDAFAKIASAKTREDLDALLGLN